MFVGGNPKKIIMGGDIKKLFGFLVVGLAFVSIHVVTAVAAPPSTGVEDG